MESKINLHFERLRLKELSEPVLFLWAIGGFFCTAAARSEGAVLFSAYSAFLLQFSAKEMSAAFLGSMAAFLLLPQSAPALLGAVGALAFFAAWFYFVGTKKTLRQQSVILGLIFLASHLLLAFWFKSSLIWPPINACSVAIAYALLNFSQKNIQNRRQSFAEMTKEELLCPFLLMLMLILGTSNLAIGGINLQHILFHALLLLAVSNIGTASAIMTGLFLGLTGTLSSGENAALIGYLALCAGVGSLGVDYGKLGIFGAYAAGSLLLGWIISDWYGLVYLAGEILAAGVIFFAVPPLKNRPAPLTKRRPRENGYAKIAQAVGVLSRPRPELIGAKDDSPAICTRIYLRVCHQCANKEYCWQKNPEATKKALDEAYQLALSLGPQTAPLSENLKHICLHSETLREAITAQIMLDQKDEKHSKELSQMKEACNYELSLISKALRELNYTSANNYEHALRSFLKSQGLNVQYARLTLHDGAFTAEIVLKECIEECEQTVSALLGSYFKQEYFVCKRECSWQNQYCRIFLRPAEKYFLSVHAVQRRAKGENLCGDIWRHFKINEHLECVLLIDGMGIGEKAYRQSSYAADLLEEMLKSSISTADALNLTNNHLLLAGLEESFISLELLLVDTFDFSAEFYKACGSISYFLHENKVQKLTAQALPLGILAEGRAQKQLLHFKCGDRLLILSDGMAENGVNWVEILPALPCSGAEAGEEILRLSPESADDQSAILLDIWSIKQNGS